MKIQERPRVSVVVVLMVAAVLAWSAPASALIVNVLENPGGNTLNANVIENPFNEGGFAIAGTIQLRETWTDAQLQAIIFSIEVESGEEGTRWAVEKLIVNQTGVDFHSFENELLNCSDGPCIQSNEADGVDFAQGTGLPRTSDVFPNVFVDELAERDFIQFFGGILPSPPGNPVDNQRFFIDLGDPIVGLRQEPNPPSARVPEPSALLLLGTGLVALAMARRRATHRG